MTTLSHVELTPATIASIRSDLERIYEHDGACTACTAYPEGIRIELDYLAGSYSSKGAWINIRLGIDNVPCFDGGTYTAWLDLEARSPRGAITVIRNALKKTAVRL